MQHRGQRVDQGPARHHALRADRDGDVGARRHAARRRSRTRSPRAARCWPSSRSSSARSPAARPARRTIAGIFATNIAGARRIRVGAARDHLLGVRGVNGRGEIFKSGGRVMKNVTGYDLCRGLSGSWGTLAVMSEVTFKVLPAPEDTGTLILLGLPDEIAVEVLCAAMAHALRGVGRRAPAAVARGPALARGPASAGPGASPRCGSRTSPSRSPTAPAGSRSISRPTARSTSSTARTRWRFWGELRQLSVLQGSDAPLWRISTSPSAGPKVVAAISAYMECRAFYDWSGGLSGPRCCRRPTPAPPTSAASSPPTAATPR